MRLRLIAQFAFLALSLKLVAQPSKFGCHYFRNGGEHIHQPHALTPEEREGIADVIARSDTFDIQHYDIAIDVTDYIGRSIKAATTVEYTPLIQETLSLIHISEPTRPY